MFLLCSPLDLKGSFHNTLAWGGLVPKEMYFPSQLKNGSTLKITEDIMGWNMVGAGGFGQEIQDLRL